MGWLDNDDQWGQRVDAEKKVKARKAREKRERAEKERQRHIKEARRKSRNGNWSW